MLEISTAGIAIICAGFLLAWALAWSWLGTLNFLVLQWFGVRLARVYQRVLVGDHPSCFRHVRWTLVRWVWPLTGWWSDYRWISKRGGRS